MADRLSALDVSFLDAEQQNTPMHVGAVAILRTDGSALTLDRLTARVERRLDLVPHFRQRIRLVPAGLGRPVWADDVRFDAAYHVRRVALPAPGGPAQLNDLAGRLTARPLDRSRPLWELYLVEGLADGRVAIISKTHPAMIDAAGGLDLFQVLFDAEERPTGPIGGSKASRAAGALAAAPEETDFLAGTIARATAGPARRWRPSAERGQVGLAVDALGDLAGAAAGGAVEIVRNPRRTPEVLRAGTQQVGGTALRALGITGGGFVAAIRTAARPAPSSPLNVPLGAHRRFATATTELETYRKIRARHGVTVNDVVLAAVAGALREWLLTRSAPVRTGSLIRAMVPTSINDGRPAVLGEGVGTGISTFLVDLPVGEANPAVRLAQVAWAMRGHVEPGRRVGADALSRLTGFAPVTLQAIGARAATGLSRRLFNLVITNAPGPQRQLQAAGAELTDVFPIVPLAAGQALAVGVTSYAGRVFYGLHADRDALPDVGILAGLIDESLSELAEVRR